MTIRNAKLYVDNKTKEFKLKDHLAYVRGEPETVAKDFNLYTETGIYSWSSVANILNSCPNRPTDEFGTLEVKNDHTGIIYQRYEAVNNVVYLRSHLNSKWTEWEKEVNQKYVDKKIVIDEEGIKTNANIVLKVTDKEIIGNVDTETIKVSPSMGIEVIED